MGQAKEVNMWQQMLRESSVRLKLPIVNLLVMGEEESGKQTLLDAMQSTSWGPSQASNEHLATSSSSSSAAAAAAATAFGFENINILDPKAKADASQKTSDDDVIAKINAWSVSDIKLKELLPVALRCHPIEQTVAIVLLDLNKPWTFKSSLEQWLTALEGAVLEQIIQLPIEKRNELYQRIKQHLLEYEEPKRTNEPALTSPGAAVSIELSTKKEFLEDGVLCKNLGIPIVFVVAKAELRSENSVKMDYIEYFLRQTAIKYGAAVVYTSSRSGVNVEALKAYILHRAFPTTFKFDIAPQLVEKTSIMIPSGYDSLNLIQQSLVGSTPKWANDKPFEKIVPPPEDIDDSVLLNAEIRVDSHERWLEKLEKAAGSGLENLQKDSIEANRSVQSASAVRRLNEERRKDENKEVSSKHLANFFNNLLSRPEKTKAATRMSSGDLKRSLPPNAPSSVLDLLGKPKGNP